MKKTCGLYSLLLIAILTAFQLWPAVTHVQYASLAQGSPTIFLQPTENVFYTNQTSIHDRFNVTVRVQDVPLTAAWQVYMEFDDSVINVTRWFEPVTDPQYIFYGKTTYANPTPPDSGYLHLSSNIGRVQMAGTLWLPPPAQEPVSGNGTLCILEFVITRYPTSGNIFSLLHIDSENTFLLDSDGVEINSVTKLDDSFNYVFATVPPLRLVANPQFIQFIPYQNITGSSFNMTVAVDGPALEAGLTNVSFTLNYEKSLFSTDASNVFLNSAWIGPHSILIDTGQATITVSNPSPLPLEPNVTICVIAFTVQEQQTAPPQTLGDHVDMSINFTSSTMLNNAGNVIDQTSPYNQTIRIYAYQAKAAILEITKPVIISTGASAQNPTWFNVNVSVTDVYDPSFIQVELLYNKSAITCIEVNSIGKAEYERNWAFNITQPGQVIANVSISEHTNPILSGPIFQFKFRTLIENATSYLNFSHPYGNGTFIRDSLGAMVNAAYVETAFPVGETPDASSSAANPPWELIIPAMVIVVVAITILLVVRSRRRKKT